MIVSSKYIKLSYSFLLFSGIMRKKMMMITTSLRSPFARVCLVILPLPLIFVILDTPPKKEKKDGNQFFFLSKI